MSGKRKLIEFVLQKHEKIKSYGCTVPFIKNEDILNILHWSKKECDDVWKIISENVGKESISGLAASLCPWCVLHYKVRKEEDCDNCSYAEVHNCCGNPSSNTYSSITYHLIRREQLSISQSLPSSWYLEVVTRIENKWK